MEQDKHQVWKDVMEYLKVVVSPAIYSTWLSRTYLTDLKKNEGGRFNAEIGCHSTFVRTTLEQRYYGLIQDALAKTLQAPTDLAFVIKTEPFDRPEDNPQVTEAPLFEEKRIDEFTLNKLAYAHLRPFFTFENFAVSGSNQLAWAATQAVATTPGVAYNPLFLWGGVGVGKTHLMNAVGIEIIKKDSNAKILSCTGEDFTNDIISGIRNKTTQVFREKYRKLTALFIDDIQFIAGKDTVQEEFFHTFNAITAAGGQIILTSDRPPSEISKLEERLRSRFEAGLIVDIAPPDFELRCAIVQIKAREKQIDIPDEIVRVIAGNLETARKIEGFLVKLSSQVKLNNAPMSEELVKTMMVSGAEEIRANQNLKPDEIVEAVCKYYNLSRRALFGASRSQMISKPRQILMYLIRTETGAPLEEIGRIVGRDHSTVIHAVDKITALASDDVNIRGDLLGIKKNYSG